MQFASTNCCGIQEIICLSDSVSPDEAMQSFCSKTLGTTRAVLYKGMKGRHNTIYSFYMFTAALPGPRTPKDDYTNHYYRPYGDDFAKFIKLHKLGKVTTLPAKVNEAFHPDHQVKAWIWSPNKDSLAKWWQERQLVMKAEKEAKSLTVAAILEPPTGQGPIPNNVAAVLCGGPGDYEDDNEAADDYYNEAEDEEDEDEEDMPF